MVLAGGIHRTADILIADISDRIALVPGRGGVPDFRLDETVSGEGATSIHREGVAEPSA